MATKPEASKQLVGALSTGLRWLARCAVLCAVSWSAHATSIEPLSQTNWKAAHDIGGHQNRTAAGMTVRAVN